MELAEPRKALDQTGAKTCIVSTAKREIVAMKHHDKGDKFTVDMTVDSADPDAFDALGSPGGVINANELCTSPDAIKFVKAFFDSHKPVAAIVTRPGCLLKPASVDRILTSWPSLLTDIRNAVPAPFALDTSPDEGSFLGKYRLD